MGWTHLVYIFKRVFPPLKINLTIAWLSLKPFHLIFTLEKYSDFIQLGMSHTSF